MHRVHVCVHCLSKRLEPSECLLMLPTLGAGQTGCETKAKDSWGMYGGVGGNEMKLHHNLETSFATLETSAYVDGMIAPHLLF